MTKNPKDLTPEERRKILEQARERIRREYEDEVIARELARQEAEQAEREKTA